MNWRGGWRGGAGGRCKGRCGIWGSRWGEGVGGGGRWVGVWRRGRRTGRKGEFLGEERGIRGRGGKRGKPVPLISSKRPLDPGNSNCFEPPHPICGNLWQHLPDVLDEDFEQAVMRRPVFRQMSEVGDQRSEVY